MRFTGAALKLAVAAVLLGGTSIGASAQALQAEDKVTRPVCQPCPAGKVCLCDPNAAHPTATAVTLMTRPFCKPCPAGKVCLCDPDGSLSTSTAAALRVRVTSEETMTRPFCKPCPAGKVCLCDPDAAVATPTSDIDLHQRDEPMAGEDPTSALASILAASSLWPEGITPQMTPSSAPPLPTDCTDSLIDQFAMQLVFTPTYEAPVKRSLSNLGIWLINGTLLDTFARLGTIVANHQLQFDAFSQSGAIYTAGFSACGPTNARVLALGGNTTFWGCTSGGFANIYDENVAPQCVAAEIRLVHNEDSTLPLLAPSDNAPAEIAQESSLPLFPPAPSVAYSYAPRASSANATTQAGPTAFNTRTIASVESEKYAALSSAMAAAKTLDTPDLWLNSTAWMTPTPRSRSTTAEDTAKTLDAPNLWLNSTAWMTPTPHAHTATTVASATKQALPVVTIHSTHTVHWLDRVKRTPGGPDQLANDGANSDPFPFLTTVTRTFQAQTFTDVDDAGNDEVVTIPAMTKTLVLGPKDQAGSKTGSAIKATSTGEAGAAITTPAQTAGATSSPTANAIDALTRTNKLKERAVMPILPPDGNGTVNTGGAAVTVTEVATAYETTTFPVAVVTVTSDDSTTADVDAVSLPLEQATTVVIVDQTVTVDSALLSTTREPFTFPAGINTSAGALGVLINATNATAASLWSGWSTISTTAPAVSGSQNQMTLTSTAVVSFQPTTLTEGGGSSTASAAASTTSAEGAAGRLEGATGALVVGAVGLMMLF
ncbi:unnamed protein product [Zymoseptoria tritici ST99CH_3D7]|uniref:Cell wall mannoprotein PIR1-like C-terminal domain-containing protein n=1 Tax=Zymoseptoria tritici (strain ST99CH_3D7) TaxID=1276538 RepID=A0A1X7RPA8_ZYMT9|nr:unnamed protein product [Zymoseptoria tritici ST99CH_3D7]